MEIKNNVSGLFCCAERFTLLIESGVIPCKVNNPWAVFFVVAHEVPRKLVHGRYNLLTIMCLYT